MQPERKEQLVMTTEFFRICLYRRTSFPLLSAMASKPHSVLGAVVRGRALQSWWCSLLQGPRSISMPQAGMLALLGEYNLSLQNLSRFWNLVGFFFGPPWNRANIKNNKIKNTHVRGIVVSKHLFLALCFYSDACFSLVWSEQQVSELRNLAREKLAWNHFVLSTKMPQALCEWYISAEVTLAEMLWPPPDCSQWHQALQAKRRHLGKITPLKLPAEELNLTPTNCCTIVTGINWIC